MFKNKFRVAGLLLVGAFLASCHKDIDYEPLMGATSLTFIESGVKTRLTRVQFLENKKTGYISGQVGVLLKSSDAGNSWQSINTGKTINYNSVFFINEQTGFLVSPRTDQGAKVIPRYLYELMKTTDGGTTWSKPTINATGVDAQNLTDIAFVNNTIGWMVGSAGQVFKTIDGGSTWDLQNLTDTLGMRQDYLDKFYLSNPIGTPNANGGKIKNTNLTRIKIVSENEIYICGAFGTILKTRNGGQNWNYLKTNDINTMNDMQILSDRNLVACGANGAVLSIKNNIAYDATNKANTRNFRAMYFVNENVGFCAGDHGYIYKTLNSGDTWSNELAPDQSIYILYSAVSLEKESVLFVGNNGTILKLSDESLNTIK